MSVYTVDPYPINEAFNSNTDRDVISRVHINGTLNNPFDVDIGWSVEIRYPFSNLLKLQQNTKYPPNGFIFNFF